jgi:hypothetical protein
MVVVTQMQPQNTQIRVTSQEGRREGVKQVEGRRCRVRQVWVGDSILSVVELNWANLPPSL